MTAGGRDAAAPPSGGSASTTPRRGDSDLAAIGRLLAEPARCRMLLALDDGRAQPASTLARAAGVAASTASGHLAQLAAGGLLSVEAHGRHRYYRLADARVGRLIEALGALAPQSPVRSLSDDTRAAALRECRTCYDHLAGRVGVALMDQFISQRWLVGDPADDVSHPDAPVGAGHELDYRITPAGRAFLDAFGVQLPPRRRAVRYCIDWTEQRHHLAGALGAGLLTTLLSKHWVRRVSTGRAALLTDQGRRGFADQLGLALG